MPAVPAVQVGAVLGKGGAHIAQIRGMSGARVQLQGVRGAAARAGRCLHVPACLPACRPEVLYSPPPLLNLHAGPGLSLNCCRSLTAAAARSRWRGSWSSATPLTAWQTRFSVSALACSRAWPGLQRGWVPRHSACA